MSAFEEVFRGFNLPNLHCFKISNFLSYPFLMIFVVFFYLDANGHFDDGATKPDCLESWVGKRVADNPIEKET